MQKQNKTENLGFLLLLLVEFSLILGGGLLVLLVFRHQVIHVGLCLSELHLVHALALIRNEQLILNSFLLLSFLTCVPMEESLPPEHSGELLPNPLEQLLDGGGVADEGGGHLETSGRNVTNSGLHVVRDPLDEVGGVLILRRE